MAKTLTRAASATPGGSFLLTKASTDDVTNGLDIFWFGKRPAATDGTGWFKNDRHADIRSADDLGLSNLSGSYSFADEQTASAFEHVARELGASVESRGKRTVLADIGVAIHGNVGAVFLLLSLLFLSFALFWTWAGSLDRSRSIRLMYGESRPVLQRDDLESLARISWPPALVGIVMAAGVMLGLHRFHAVGAFLLTYAALAAVLIVAAFFSAFVFLMAFTPSVGRIAARADGSMRVRLGNNAVKLLCLVMAFLSLPLSLNAAQQALKEKSDADVWQQARQAVTFDVQPAYQQERYVRNFQTLFIQTDNEGIMGLSYSVGSMLVRTTGPPAPSQAQIDAQLAPFDDVIMTNLTFLDLLHVDRTALKRIDEGSLPTGLKSALQDYKGVWFNDRAGEASYTLYTWSGDSSFPALLHAPEPGSLAVSNRPLIFVVDSPSKTLSATGFLIPGLTSGNMLFTDLNKAQEAIRANGLGGIAYSASTVPDAALYASQQLRDDAIVDVAAAIFAMLTGLFCALQSARLWALEQRTRIFIRCAAGASYWQILQGGFLLQTCIEMAIAGGAAAVCALFFMMPAQAWVPIGIAIVFIVFEWFASLASARIVFRRFVQRHAQ